MPQHGCASVSLGTCSSLAIWGGQLGVVISKRSFQFLCLTLAPHWVSCFLPSSAPFSNSARFPFILPKCKTKPDRSYLHCNTVIIVLLLKSFLCLWCLHDVLHIGENVCKPMCMFVLRTEVDMHLPLLLPIMFF